MATSRSGISADCHRQVEYLMPGILLEGLLMTQHQLGTQLVLLGQKLDVLCFVQAVGSCLGAATG